VKKTPIIEPIKGQMINLEVKATLIAPFGTIKVAFFRVPGGRGKIFHTAQIGSRRIVCPVLRDGTILPEEEHHHGIEPETNVHVIPQELLGIVSIKWSQRNI